MPTARSSTATCPASGTRRWKRTGTGKPRRSKRSPRSILAGSGVPFTFERRRGAPAEAILAGTSAVAAASGSAPVIVVGRSGHALHHVLGSVPVHLLHHSAYPVLAIP